MAESAIERAVTYILRNNPAVVAIVDDRVRVGSAEQAEPTPYVVMSSNARRFPTLSGNSNGLVLAELEVNAYDTTQEGARTLGNAVRLAIDNQTGTINGEQVYQLNLEDEDDDYVAPVDAKAKGTFVRIGRYQTMFGEEVA